MNATVNNTKRTEKEQNWLEALIIKIILSQNAPFEIRTVRDIVMTFCVKSKVNADASEIEELIKRALNILVGEKYFSYRMGKYIPKKQYMHLIKNVAQNKKSGKILFKTIK